MTFTLSLRFPNRIPPDLFLSLLNRAEIYRIGESGSPARASFEFFHLLVYSGLPSPLDCESRLAPYTFLPIPLAGHEENLEL